MADQFVQAGTGATGTTTATDTLTGVTAGNTIIAFAYDGTATGRTLAVADAQGSYTQLTPPGDVNNATNNITSGIFVLKNANAGTHAVQVTIPAGESAFVVAVEVQAPTAWTTTNTANGASQSNPGAGANILSSGTMTIASASTIISLINDCSSVTGSDTPTAGTSPIAFTSRRTGNNSAMGVWRIQTAAASSNAAATGGSVTTTDEFISLAIAVPNPSSGPTSTAFGLAAAAALGLAGTGLFPAAISVVAAVTDTFVGSSRKQWRVPTTASNGTAVHVIVFSGTSPTYSILAQGVATVDASGYAFIDSAGNSGDKAFAFVHNYSDNTASTSIFGGAGIGTVP